MIRAVVTKNRVSLSGHAGYAPAGQDIVCAAVSALVFALAEAAEQRGGVRELVIRPGRVTVAVKEDCADYLRVAVCGLHQLAERYPQCVAVEGQELRIKS